MNNALAEKGLFYNTKSKCIEKIRWRAKKNCMYYYIDFNDPNSFCVASRTETFDYIDECKIFKAARNKEIYKTILTTISRPKKKRKRSYQRLS